MAPKFITITAQLHDLSSWRFHSSVKTVDNAFQAIGLHSDWASLESYRLVLDIRLFH